MSLSLAHSISSSFRVAKTKTLGTDAYRQMTNYKPLRLRSVLEEFHISQRALCNVVHQFDGKPLSGSALNLLLNWGTWPRKTTPHSIKQQVEAHLKEKGLPAGVIATLWEVEDPGSTPAQHKTGHMAVIPPRLQRLALFKDFLSKETEMLSDEAKQLFGITHSPFINDVNEEADLYTNKQIIYVRNVMWNTAKLGGFVAVAAEVGAGKSTLRRWVEDRIQREKSTESPVRVITPRLFGKERLTAGMLCEAIIRDLNPDERMPVSMENRARKVERMLTASLQEGNKHVIIIEEAHLLTIHMLKALKPFIELEKGFKKMLSIILIGQPELLDKLNARMHPEAREVIQRIEVVQLPGIDKDVKGYLALKFKRVGILADQVFDTNAYDAIVARLTDKGRNGHVESICYPLTVNNLVIKALNEAAAAGLKKVNADVIRDL
ncbi:MAG TPA: AAA family ATPase [Usitatibacteraceae bacterium]